MGAGKLNRILSYQYLDSLNMAERVVLLTIAHLSPDDKDDTIINYRDRMLSNWCCIDVRTVRRCMMTLNEEGMGDVFLAAVEGYTGSASQAQVECKPSARACTPPLIPPSPSSPIPPTPTPPYNPPSIHNTPLPPPLAQTRTRTHVEGNASGDVSTSETPDVSGNDGEKLTKASVRSIKPGRGEYSEDFNLWWAHYPATRRSNKKRCFIKWCDIIASKEATKTDFFLGLIRWLNSHDWNKDDGQFVPAPLVWFNQCKWEAQPNKSAYYRIHAIGKYILTSTIPGEEKIYAPKEFV